MVHGFSRFAACGIFPDQGSNPCPLALAGGFLTTAPPGKFLHRVSAASLFHSGALTELFSSIYSCLFAVFVVFMGGQSVRTC